MRKPAALLLSTLLTLSIGSACAADKPIRTLFGLTFGEDTVEQALSIYGGCAKHKVNGKFHELILPKGSTGACKLFDNPNATVNLSFRTEDQAFLSATITADNQDDLLAVLSSPDIAPIATDIEPKYFPYTDKIEDFHGDLDVRINEEANELIIRDYRKELQNLENYRRNPDAFVPTLGNVFRLGKSTPHSLKLVMKVCGCELDKNPTENKHFLSYSCKKPVLDKRADSAILGFIDNTLVLIFETYENADFNSLKTDFEKNGWVWLYRTEKFDEMAHPQFLGDRIYKNRFLAKIFGSADEPGANILYRAAVINASCILDYHNKETSR